MSLLIFFYLIPVLLCLVLFALWPLREGRFKPTDWAAMAVFTLVPLINLLVALLFSYAVGATAWRARN